jgi:hypothetical protein
MIPDSKIWIDHSKCLSASLSLNHLVHIQSSFSSRWSHKACIIGGVMLRRRPTRVGGALTFPNRRMLIANVEDGTLTTFSSFSHLRRSQ